ncbi:unnamed protein product [Cylicostephanus goldi]|uniref:Uncharacterized protein n=1 Tax=Cylicostephanus goldi TaxID=71465 RepID=A0A3P6RQI3_CYLGO|nr:unnamed protein product [Cylicostephanus goldi]
MDLDSIRAKVGNFCDESHYYLLAKNPEDLLSATKKGQTVMMFVNIRDPSNPTVKSRPYTERTADVFNSMLHNNHMVSQVCEKKPSIQKNFLEVY